MADTFKFNLNKTLIISALLHASFFVVAIFVSMKTIKPLPLGVELNFDAAPAAPKAAPVAAMPVTMKKTAPVIATSEDVVSKTAPAAALPQETSTAATTSSSATSVAVTGREGVANGSEVSAEERYLYELKKLLERRKSYPNMAKKMGHAGTVTMRFTLKADGSLSNAEVVGKAPYETLNQAAVSLVQGIDGLKPFPQDIHRDTWSITVPIEYTLK
jgi:protein TonB